MPTDRYTYIAPEAPTASAAGELMGCRVCLQPALSVRGWPTDAGSPALKGYIAMEDAFVVRRLRDHGAQLMASVRMSELGFGLAGDTTGAAVREECDAGVVVDAFGESRIIAARHGLLGFKPSQGTVSRGGLIGLMPSMETAAVVVRDPGIVRPIMHAMVAPDDQDFTMLHAGLPDFAIAAAPPRSIKTVGVIVPAVERLEPAAQAAFRARLERVTRNGFAVRDVALPSWPLFRAVHQALGCVEAASATGRFDSVRYGHRTKGASNWNEMYLQSRAESFGTLVKSFLFQGAYMQFQAFEAYEAACRLRHRLVHEVNNLFEAADVLALPVWRDAANPERDETVEAVYDRFEMTLPANLLGTPAAALPPITDPGGDDPGLQLVAPRMRDRDLADMTVALAG